MLTKFVNRDTATTVLDGVERPVHAPIDAMQWTGQNHEEIAAWAQDMIMAFPHPRLSDGRLIQVIDMGTANAVLTVKNSVFRAQRAKHGDWILFMSGSTGEFCVLGPDDFHARFMKEAA